MRGTQFYTTKLPEIQIGEKETGGNPEARPFLQVKLYVLLLNIIKYFMPFKQSHAVQFILNPQQLVVLGNPVGTAE